MFTSVRGYEWFVFKPKSVTERSRWSLILAVRHVCMWSPQRFHLLWPIIQHIWLSSFCTFDMTQSQLHTSVLCLPFGLSPFHKAKVLMLTVYYRLQNVSSSWAVYCVLLLLLLSLGDIFCAERFLNLLDNLILGHELLSASLSAAHFILRLLVDLAGFHNIYWVIQYCVTLWLWVVWHHLDFVYAR